jgi:hypothetical protein
VADEAWVEHYYGQQPPHSTCLETTVLAGVTSYVCGPDCPKPQPAGPDPERDKRIDAYRDRERRRAARALDRYFDAMHGTNMAPTEVMAAAGERFVEQVGDYVLARLGHDPSVVQHKSHYGVSGVAPAMKGKWQLWMHECGHVEHWEEGTAPADGGCDACESGSNNASDWRPLYTDMQEGRPEWTPDEQHNADSVVSDE